MKKIFLLALVVLGTLNLEASHLMGGEITVKDVQNGQFEIILTLYRDTVGLGMFSPEIVQIYDQSGNSHGGVSCVLDTSAMHPNLGLQNGSPLPFFPAGVEVYFYKGVFQASASGEYLVSWNKCCRNGAISNISNPVTADMNLFTRFTIDSSSSHSTPVFLATPIVYLPVNTPWQYNPLPYDSDGDSLIWSLDVPYGNSGGAMLGDSLDGYTDPPSASGGQFTIDYATGTISWTASTVGNFVYTVTCEEFRNGVKVGEIRRDMQLIVFASNPISSLMGLENLSLNSDGVPYVTVAPDSTFSLVLYATDSSVTDLNVQCIGESFHLSNHMTYSQNVTSNPHQSEVLLNWTPTVNEEREEPYAVVVRVMNGTFMIDYTFFVYVGENDLSLGSEEGGFDFEIYPNPSNGEINALIISKGIQVVNLNVVNSTGQSVHTESYVLAKGKNIISTDLDLPQGVYFISFLDRDHINFKTKKVIFSK